MFSLTDLISCRGFKHMTVSDSWSVSRRRKSTASSGVGYRETINALFLRKDWTEKMNVWLKIHTQIFSLQFVVMFYLCGRSCLLRQVTANRQTSQNSKLPVICQWQICEINFILLYFKWISPRTYISDIWILYICICKKNY